MRRVVAAVIAISLPARAAPAQASPRMRSSSATWADAGWVAAAGVLYVIPGALGLPRGAPSCAPCDPATLPGFDRWAVRPVVRGADAASSAVLIGVAGWTALAGLRGLPADRWHDNLTRFAEVTSWTAASTEWLKVLVRRKRPVLYTSDAAAAAADRDNQRSLPSGHTSLAFSAATAYLVISRREHLPHRTRNALLLYAGAVAVGALRVAAARHFPSDVAAGAVLGVGIGWLVPTIHPTTH
jgi:membrane-associated phospholipid phosphatase